MSHKSNPARACIEHTDHLLGKCHRNDGIGTSPPTNRHGGGPSPHIRQDYEVHEQRPPTEENPIEQRKQLDTPHIPSRERHPKKGKKR